MINVKKAVMYVRVSSREQEREGLSIDAQTRLLQGYADRHNMKVVKIFRDIETAKREGRKSFSSMIQYLKDHTDIEVVMVEKTDRLYRNIPDWEELKPDTYGIEIHFVKEGEVISNNSHSSKKFLHGIKVLMAKQYIDNLSEEVKKGHEEKLKQGGWPGKAPVGYRNKLEDHSIIIDPEIGPLIRSAFIMAKSGNYSIRKLKRKLFEMGLRAPRSGKELSKATMARILSNPFYYGEIIRSGKSYSGVHKPLISKELFEEVQLMMGFRKKPTVSKYDFAFRGPLTCAYCGCQITAEVKRKPSGKRYIYYHCTNGKGYCENVVWIREEKIEESFLKAFEKIMIPEEVIKYTQDIFSKSQRKEEELRQAKIYALEKERDKLQRRIDNAYLDKLDNKISEEVWNKLDSDWRCEHHCVSLELQNLLESSSNKQMNEGFKLMKVANTASQLFPIMNNDEKREMINLVLSNLVLRGTTIEYCYKKPFNLFVGVTEIKKWRERRDSNSRPSA